MRRRAVPLTAALVAAACLVPARAADQVVSAAGNAYVHGDVSIAPGNKVTFLNADAAPHDVVADADGANGPLFKSAVATTGQQADVKGAERLKPGAYTFHCSLHPSMHGSITVTGGALTIVPTPTGGSVPTPTSATFHDGSLYVTSYGAGTVMALAVLPGGLLGAGTPYATGFDSPLGLAFAPDGTLYVADSHQPAGSSRRVGRVWAVTAASKKVVVDNLPNGRHNTNGLAVAGGRLYVANGNATDDGVNGGPAELPLNGTVLSYALPVRPGAKPTVEARGLRNVYDVAFRPGTTEAWFATNGPDALDPYGEDLLHRVDVRRGTADYGFPACVYDAALRRGTNPNVKAPCSPRATRPELAVGLHVSADGLAFGTGGVWGGDLYVAEYGSNAPPPVGHKVVRVPIVNGRAQAPQDVVVGPAPIDVAFGPDGLYVLDFDSGAITLLRAVG